MTGCRSSAQWSIVAIALSLSQLAGLAQASTDPRPPEEMEEVQVLASRLKLSELRAEIARTEDQFYEQLNALLDDPEMRVTCRVEPPLGSHISRRVCGPQFIATANANYARGMIDGLNVAASGGGGYIPPVPPGLAIAYGEGVFRRKVVGAMQDSPALRELAERRNKLEILFKAAQKARFKDGRIIARD